MVRKHNTKKPRTPKQRCGAAGRLALEHMKALRAAGRSHPLAASGLAVTTLWPVRIERERESVSVCVRIKSVCIRIVCVYA